MIKRAGLKKLEISEYDDIIIFKLGNDTYVNDLNYKRFIERFKALEKNTKIIIDFDEQDEDRYVTRSLATRIITEALTNAIDKYDIKIAIIGLNSAPWVIRNYFKNNDFPIFERFVEAVTYLNEKQSPFAW
ncbi:hypothetical protein ACFL0J_08495 [Candidatus Neomarinimicrobiota bacterium]